MRRRDFLRSAGLLSGALLSRRAHALAAVTPDSLATSSKPSIDPAQLRQQVTLAIGGDTTPGYNLQNHFDEQAAAGISRDQLVPLYFSGIQPIFDQADIALVNLECTLTNSEEKLEKNFNFKARPELV